MIALAALLPQAPLQAQMSAARLADLEQDLMALRAQVGELRSMVEALQRENAGLRRDNETQAAGAAQAYVTLQQLDVSLRALRDELLAADSQVKREVTVEVSRQIERLAAQTEQAINAVASAAPSRPAPAAAPTFTFSNDFPKTGVEYTVQPGDTISGIAKKMNSTVKDIQNANKIADPTRLMAGQKLFIPQAKE
jgi:nucleoid-associated protein YgaU